MSVLLVDLGNTALKWSILEQPDSPKTFVHHGSDKIPYQLLQAWLKLQPERIVASAVSSENIAFSLTKLFNQYQIQWDWLHSEKKYQGEFSLENCYDNYQQLGSDRWHAAIGAVSLYPDSDLLVVHIGTATTIDSVLKKGKSHRFLGGRILPGPAMMFDALLGGTRCRPEGIGVYREAPLNTADAISTAILEAHLGVLDRAVNAMKKQGSSPQIIFAGGAAPMLAPFILNEYPQAVAQHNLVLRGLALRAQKSCE